MFIGDRTLGYFLVSTWRGRIINIVSFDKLDGREMLDVTGSGKYLHSYCARFDNRRKSNCIQAHSTHFYSNYRPLAPPSGPSVDKHAGMQPCTRQYRSYKNKQCVHIPFVAITNF